MLFKTSLELKFVFQGSQNMSSDDKYFCLKMIVEPEGQFIISL